MVSDRNPKGHQSEGSGSYGTVTFIRISATVVTASEEAWSRTPIETPHLALRLSSRLGLAVGPLQARDLTHVNVRRSLLLPRVHGIPTPAREQWRSPAGAGIVAFRPP